MGPLGRRRFLKVSLAGGATLATGSYLWGFRGSAHYRRLLPPNARPVVLDEKELAVLCAFVDRILPDAPGVPTARQARIALRIDKELSFHPRKLQRDVANALFLVEHGGYLHLSPTRFSALAPEAQDRYLLRMQRGFSIERQAFAGLRLLALFYYYCDERTWGAIHYEGPLVKIPSRPPADSRV